MGLPTAQLWTLRIRQTGNCEIAAARVGRRRQGEIEQDRRLTSAGIQIKAFAHEGKEFVPSGELEIAKQGFDMLEEFLAGA